MRFWVLLVAAAFFAVGVVFVVLGGWFFSLIGIIALLMGLVLTAREVRSRRTASA
jgi:predicted Na+-dependent transporter